MLKDKIIICFSGTNWELPWGISQKIMLEFSKSNKVVFIEYQPSFLHCWFRNLSYVDYGDRQTDHMRFNDNLYVYSPRAGLPFNNYFRIVNILNQRSIKKNIKSEIDKSNPKDVILWAVVPQAIDFIDGLGKFFTIYHCLGNYAVEKDNFLRKNTISEMEKELIDRSEIVIGQTRSLCSKFKAFGKKTFYLPSAVNFDNIPEDAKRQMSVKNEFKNIGRPRIGILGYFDDSFYDVDLLEYLLDTKKEWSFVFIGPVTGKAKKFQSLQQRLNTFFLGRKDPAEIPSFIKALDIGIIPYKVNNYMKEVSPNKFYEYIACGKPVVSTELPDINNYDGSVRVAHDKTEFLKHIENFLSMTDEKPLTTSTSHAVKIKGLNIYLEELSLIIEQAVKR